MILGFIKQNKQLIIYCLLVICAGISGWLMNNNIRDIASACQVLYVSQDEIIEMEKERVKKDNLEDRQMFFGKVDEAIKLISQFARQYENNTTKVVYSVSEVQGVNVRSISREVHQKLITELVGQIKNNNIK
jgi:uncharacterized protein YsxB (DUF464 family)